MPTSSVLLRPSQGGAQPWQLTGLKGVRLTRPGSDAPPREFAFRGGTIVLPDDAMGFGEAVQSLGRQTLAPAVCHAVESAGRLCIWLHGPRCAGKSTAAWGQDGEAEGGEEEGGLAGVVARALFEEFEGQSPDELLVTVQMLKVGTQTELLGDCLAGPDFDAKLRIKEAPSILGGGFTVEGVPEAEVRTADELLSALRRGREHLGAPGAFISGKQTDTDERAHGLFTLRARQRDGGEGPVRTATVHILDLCGAELSSGGAAVRGRKDHKEDRTLKAVLRVVDSLGASPDYTFRDGRQAPRHIPPHRDAKVTRLIKDCFGGPGRSFLLAFAGAPSHDASLSALELGARHEACGGAPIAPDSLDLDAVLHGMEAEAADLAGRLGYTDRLAGLSPVDLELGMDSSDDLVRFREVLEARRVLSNAETWADIRARSRAAAASREGVGA